VAKKAAAEVLALPFHGGLTVDDAMRLSELIAWHQGGRRR
jgi:hypothetical protein